MSQKAVVAVKTPYQQSNGDHEGKKGRVHANMAN